MKKVLIVDDEQIIREGLRYLIDWEEYDFFVVATASNGKEGLIAIQEYQPDLVITDIRMPEMDGLEMIQAAKQVASSHFYSIVLSGYSEFEYAQKAVALGFTSYLLKPIDETELISILVKISQETTAKDQKKLEQRLLAKLFGSDKSGLTDFKWINCSMLQDYPPQTIFEELDECGATYVLLKNFDQFYIVWLENGQKPAIEKSFSKLFEREMSIISTDWLDSKQDLGIVRTILKEQAELAYLYPSCLVYPGKRFDKSEGRKSLETSLADIVVAILANKPIKDALSQYAQVRKEGFSNKEQIIWQTQKDVEVIVEQLEKKLQRKIDFDFGELFSSFRQASSYPALIQLLVEAFESLTRRLALELNNIELIDQVTYYVHQHYAKELSLKEVADHFGYNSAYLGKKFKKKMSEPFLNFLERVRMEKAAELLTHSNLMIYEIADRVGYKNIDYFYKKFKHFYRFSPNEYRKLHQIK